MNVNSSLSTNITSGSEALVGWVPESGGRGTLKLIYTCLVTVFLCTWVVIHPRVYESELYATLHKFIVFVKGILAPEFIAVEGLQEWAQCKRMVKECAVSTNNEFNFIHAFYISMLALRYRTHLGDRVIWPNQYTWLLRQNIITWESQASWGLSVRSIQDQNKADKVTKVITLIQVTWFVAQSIIRTVHRLPLSQLESMTLSYIPLFAVTYFFWWYKPKDILTPTIVTLPEMTEEQERVFNSMAISNKFDNEGAKSQAVHRNIWSLTPRVFEKEAEDRAIQALQQAAETDTQTASESEKEDANINTIVALESSINEDEPRRTEHQQIQLPKETVLSHWDPGLYCSYIWPAACLFGASFGALHLISWNTAFPTIVELWLWRVSAIISIVSMVVFMHFKKVVLRWGGPLTILSILSPALYFVSRIIMMGQVFAALRGGDPAIYETYEVSNYWIHFL